MSGDPLSAFLGGEPSSSSRRRRRRLLLLPPPSFPPAAAEELSNFDAMFSGVSLRSLLLDNPVSSSSPSPFSSSYSSSPPPSSPLWSPLPSPVSPFSPSPEQQQQQQLLSFRYSPSPLKMPKQEPPHCFPDFAPASSPFDSLSLADDSTLCFPLHRLSDLLRSLETLQPQSPQPPPAAAAAAAAPGPARKRSPADPERTKRAREKRRKIGDCMRQLHELVMPQVERKMDTLATLEEACKQVAYLQQLVKSALQLMPRESPQPTPCLPPRCPTDDDVGGGGGMLGRWTMQHLLERMVNSPPAQAVLYDQEYGVGAVATNQQWLLLSSRRRRRRPR
ncbi:hypothetical protein NL676_017587 [Syzygium grande]|nr:hypothetical protein NL676_017587 [Syzygium grande]